MKKIEHIGIAVSNLDQAEKLYEKLLGVKPYKRETVTSEKVITSFFQVGETKIELLAPLDKESVIHKFIQKKGEGFHHIAFAVKDIEAEIKRLKNEGFQLLAEQPKPGADNKWVVFIHPKSAGGILVELCQEQKK